MAYTTINKSSLHHDGKIYLGSSSAVTVTGLGFQPDLVWVKDRDNGNNHCLADSVRGVGKFVLPNEGDAEVDNSTKAFSAFTSDGFTTGTDNPANESASTTKGFMSWSWKAGGAGSSNTDGTINTTSTSVNTTAGFSISTYTGTGANATVGHGLGVAPKMIIIKGRSNAHWWFIYHAGIPTPLTAKLNLNTNGYNNDAQASYWNSTAPTSSVFSVGTEASVNNSGSTYVAYCFADIAGYSKMGSYIGNGNANGTFVYTGFRPTFVITKRTDNTAHWYHWDDKRIGYNPANYILFPAATSTEDGGSTERIDLLSNGFKFRHTDSDHNGSGNSYIYMAFGQTIVGTNNVCATAR